MREQGVEGIEIGKDPGVKADVVEGGQGKQAKEGGLEGRRQQRPVEARRRRKIESPHMGEHPEEGHQRPLGSDPRRRPGHVGIRMVERGALADLDFADVADNLWRSHEETVETSASFLEYRRLPLRRCCLEADFGEQVIAAGGQPCLAYRRTVPQGCRIVVQIVDDVVHELLRQARS